MNFFKPTTKEKIKSKYVNHFKKSYLLLILGLTFFMSSCRKPIIKERTDCKLVLRGFIRDCFYGDEVIGITTSHVNYNVQISVLEEPIGGGAMQSTWVTPTPINSPAGPDKSNFETTIRVPKQGPFLVRVTVNGTQCTASKTVFGCNSFEINRTGGIFLVNAGKPYWLAENVFYSIPSGNVIAMQPIPWARFPNRIPAGDCSCTIKLR